jgi:hypothetical protein
LSYSGVEITENCGGDYPAAAYLLVTPKAVRIIEFLE